MAVAVSYFDPEYPMAVAMSSFACEDLASLLNEFASRIPKLFAVGNDVVEVLLLVWKMFVDAVATENDEIEDLKRMVKESLEEAQKYRDMCAKAAQRGCIEGEIRQIKREIRFGNFSTLCSYVRDMIQLLKACTSRFVDFKNTSSLAKRKLQAAAEAAEKRDASEKGVMHSRIATAAGAVGATAGFVIGIPLAMLFAPIGIPVLLVSLAGGTITTAGGTIAVGVHAFKASVHARALNQIVLLDTPLNEASVVVTELEKAIALCQSHVSSAQRVQRRAMDRGKVSRRTIWLIEDALDKNYRSLVVL